MPIAHQVFTGLKITGIIRCRTVGWSLVRPFVNTYLKLDGTPFTAETGYETKNFVEEMKNRDLRLAQTIRGLDFKRDGKAVVADMTVCLTGYHVIKYSLDDTKYDNNEKNNNSIPLLRYAQLLLNYAEAQAELGGLTDADWNATIGALRSEHAESQAERKNSLQLLIHILQQVFYPNITNPVLLEIRRERAIELVAEGTRFNDLRRWKCGELIEELPWTGMHISALNVDIDLNGDGTPDCYFTDNGTQSSNKDCKTVNVKNETGLYATANAAGG